MAYFYTITNKEMQRGASFLNMLRQNLSYQNELKQSGLCYYFDTFDWRLYRQGYHLFHFQDTLYLFQHQKKKTEMEQKCHIESVEDIIIDDGTLKEKVNSIIGIRALMCQATFRLSIHLGRILNRDEKTIARIQFEQDKIKNKTKYRSIIPTFEIKPVRGYANQIPVILKKLSATAFSHSKDDRLKRGLQVISKEPADYSSKLNINLTKNMSAAAATKQIYIHLANIIQRNESGIIKDIDIEFLHDFRVSIRRTRSALGQIKGIFDEKTMLQAKKDFSFLGKSTNELRDIDVYLLREKQYKQMLPGELRIYLDSFFGNLKEQRKTEHQSLVRTLKSSRYRRILSNWRSHLQSTKSERNQNAISAKLLAQNVIRKRNKKVLKFGKQILATGSDELLHQLRIEGKKLRYLLEFFSSLFVQEKIQFLIGNLKLLQDNLGDYNDLSVQQEKLYTSANDIAPRNKTGKNTVLAFGVLIGKLGEKQQKVKNEFAKTFSIYADSKVQKIFDELFPVHERRSQ